MVAFAIVSTITAGVLLLGGDWAIDRWAPNWGLAPLLIAVGVNLAAGWVAFAVIEVVRRRRPEYLPQAAMGAMVIRLFPAGAVTLGAMLFGGWNPWAVSICMLVAYLVFLAVDTVFVVRIMSRARFENRTEDDGSLSST